MEICEAPSLPIEKHAISPLSWPFQHCTGHSVRSLLLAIMARRQIWFTHCWSYICCSLLGFVGGGLTLLSSSRVLLMFGSREGSCWEKWLLSSKEFASWGELEDACAVSFSLALAERCTGSKAQRCFGPQLVCTE